MDDCQSFSSKPKWMERECQSLMCLMTRRDIEIEIEIFHQGIETNALALVRFSPQRTGLFSSSKT